MLSRILTPIVLKRGITTTSGIKNILSSSFSSFSPQFPPGATSEQIQRFKQFNEAHGKFRVAIINQCNMNCFFCHNEGMSNPRQTGKSNLPSSIISSKSHGPAHLSIDDFIAMINAFTRMGGNQVNITGGEPLTHPDIVSLLNAIEKRNTKIILNSNVLNAKRLLDAPFISNLTSIFASLHTTKDEIFKRDLGVVRNGAKRVMDNMIALKEKKGYDLQINYSLGDYNKDEFGNVVDFGIKHGIHVKAIALIRANTKPDFYNGLWIDPKYISSLIESRNLEVIGNKAGFGGHTKIYRANNKESSIIQVKNIATGRLVTDFCKGCSHLKLGCGEGIYALRSGVDGIFKPCLLRKEKFSYIDNGRLNNIPLPASSSSSMRNNKAEALFVGSNGELSLSNVAYRRDPANIPNTSYEIQILRQIENMVGDWNNAYYQNGPPEA